MHLKVLHVVGARPNFMKAAPVMMALAAYSEISQKLVHTGQHYDANMSDIFFQQLDLPKPDFNLEVGSGSHACQTSQIMMRFEEVVLKERPDLVLVYGDVNSTVAAALVCAKLLIPVGHVEAGLRSFDRSMPEEINRLLTDQVAELLFTPSQDGNDNLLREGIAPDKIHLVGNVMIDTLNRLLPLTSNYQITKSLNLAPRSYGLITLHRPSNVDDQEMLSAIWETLKLLSRDVTLVFPIHPRTRDRVKDWGMTIPNNGSLQIIEPLGYLEFLALQKDAALVITDSGGIQEETTFLGIPCLTLRKNTERPVTVEIGTNILLGEDLDLLKNEVMHILAGKAKVGAVPPLWDGKAGERIGKVISELNLNFC